MHVYLPIAELSMNLITLIAVGSGVGFLSGLFGVGGGFLITPLLIVLGVPPAVAAATGANQAIAPAVSGVIGHWRRGTVDVKIGGLMVLGGFAGSALSVALFTLLRRLGQIELVIAVTYVVLLGFVGVLMLSESLLTIRRRYTGTHVRRKLHRHIWVHRLPLKLRFPRSRLYVSALLPAGIGFAVGVLAGLMGVGGGFLLVPAMVYLLGMPTAVVVGTSLFQVIFVSANVTLLQAISNQSVDVMLASLLVIGGMVGAPLGARLGARLRGEHMRALMALLVLGVAVELGLGLIRQPQEPYSIASDMQASSNESGGVGK